MYKVIDGTKISFFDNENNEIMYIDYLSDECIWHFSTNEVIITKDMELYDLLINIMSGQYVFNLDEILQCTKQDNKMVWYSDCYYNPDDEWSRNSVSCLIIELYSDNLKLKCIRPLDEVLDKMNEDYTICFSPLGNGRYTRNIKTGLTLQDDFVLMIYQSLLNKEKTKMII